MKLVHYRLIYHATASILAQKVDQARRNGWLPFGDTIRRGPASTFSGRVSDAIFTQAMVKYEG